MSASTFGDWLTEQTYRNDPVGDLARDYIATCLCAVCKDRDGVDPSPAGVRAELDDHNAIPEAYEALERAVAEWA